MSSHNPFHHQTDASKPRTVPLKQELPQKNKKNRTISKKRELC